jgi:hypothetical protein
MTTNEITLINAIRNHKDPEKAFLTAVSVIADVLMRQEASAAQAPDSQA